MIQTDLIVIGAGPAGLLAAATAAEHGASVVVLERMDHPGRKLRLCGHGRGNIGNTAPMDEFLRHFGHNVRFLRPAFAHFFTPQTRNLFSHLGVPTTIEPDGRIFPCSDNARDLVNALIHHARTQGVQFLTQHRVRSLVRAEHKFQVMHNDQTCLAQRIILATGGASYPTTGSSGDGYALAQSLGHSLIPITPALVPLVTAGSAVDIQGLSFRHVRVQVRADGKKCAEKTGEILCTHFGLSGPAILAVSREAVRALAQGQAVEIRVDLFPDHDHGAVDARLRTEIASQGRKQLSNFLRIFLPPKAIPACLEQTGLLATALARDITALERKNLRNWLKEWHFTVTGHRSLAEAMVTAGGIPLPEVNPKTMESRLCPGLYFAGEILDLDADTGGFNLQAALSTGYLAGRSAALDKA